MFDLSRITVFCFAASYTVALALEAVALVGWREGKLAATLAGGRRWGVLAFSVAGLLAQMGYLAAGATQSPTPLSSPAEWFLVAAAVLAAGHLGGCLAYKKWPVGLFLLPIVLGLIGLSLTASHEPIAPERASLFWGQAHGWSLVAATASVSVGFVAGVMYLLQSWRLRSKLPPAVGIRLPSLEWLEGVSARSLSASVWLTAAGLVSGVVLTRLRRDAVSAAALWTDPVVLTTSALLAWLLAASAFRWAYPGARRGRRVAYLTVTAFGFLVLTVGLLAMKGPAHGGADQPPAAAASN